RAGDRIVADVELLEERLRKDGVEVQRGGGEEIRLPGVRADLDARGAGLLDHLPRDREPAAARKIGLGDIDLAEADEQVEAPGGSFLFARRDAERAGLRDGAIS